jgi:sialic acid synthase SpsE
MALKKVFFIAEIGNNHNGDIERAKRLIKKAKIAGADVAKFQMRDLESLYRNGINNVEDLGVEYIKELLIKFELTQNDHQLLFEYCASIGIEYMCTPWDIISFNKLVSMGVNRFKVASADFDNFELVKAIVSTGKQIILSTGMATLNEISERVKWLEDKNANYIILHCNSTYPAPFEDIQLRFLENLKEITNNIGYSGHERGISVSLAAVALGSKVIERHITEDRNLEGPDHQASLLPDEFTAMVSMAKEIEIALGPALKKDRKLSQGALLNKEILGKSLVASSDLKAGTLIKKKHLLNMSPGQGVSPNRINELLGKKLVNDIKKHDFVFVSDVSAKYSKETYEVQGKNWGIPVRPHDVKKMVKIFNPPVIEFHLSYKDLDREWVDDDWSFLKDRKLVVHAPELFSNSQLLDLCATKEIELHIKNLNKVCDFSRNLALKAEYNDLIPIVANIGGFSTHGFRDISEKRSLYDAVAKNLLKIDEEGCEILIQNMAPFPWHFGGQRFQNIFLDSNEINEFCHLTGRSITLDTAHLSMYCHYLGLNFNEEFNKLLNNTKHFHMSDAS